MTEPARDGDLIPLKEFALRLGRNVEATRRRFSDIAVEKRGRLYFRTSDLARLIKEEQRDDDHEFEVARSWLAKLLEVDPRTVDKRHSHLNSRVVNGQRRYRKTDIKPILKEVHDNELLTEIEITLLFRGGHFWQLHLLRDFPKMFRSASDEVPRHDDEGPMGFLWKRKTIEQWARKLTAAPRAVLTDNAIALFEAAANPIDNACLDVPAVRAHFERILKRLEGIGKHELHFRQQKAARRRRLGL